MSRKTTELEHNEKKVAVKLSFKFGRKAAFLVFYRTTLGRSQAI